MPHCPPTRSARPARARRRRARRSPWSYRTPGGTPLAPARAPALTAAPRGGRLPTSWYGGWIVTELSIATGTGVFDALGRARPRGARRPARVLPRRPPGAARGLPHGPPRRRRDRDRRRARLGVGDLVGHDWGGAVAWWTAHAHPGRVRTLTVVSTPTRALWPPPCAPTRTGADARGT
ncbi:MULTISPECIES: alpha/beta fold hydrolase [unclassified Streptomyces]|uniref:alpha/beta fold hydrolase n=1 Tax=unclassified Streptomyces TaxID=2593676 RepID=UPI003083E73B